MKLLIDPRCHEITREYAFHLFRHAGLLCCVMRNMRNLTLNGYVAVDRYHPLYEKDYDSLVYVKEWEKLQYNGNILGLMVAASKPETELGMIPLHTAINVHCGITWAHDHIAGVDENVFGKLWWFGFDTNHAGDLNPLLYHFIEWEDPLLFEGYTYRNEEFVIEQTKSMAEQLAAFIPERSELEQAYINYKSQKSLRYGYTENTEATVCE